MTGQKGLTVAIVALLITLCFGFLANVEETPSTRTVYSDQVNLEPLIYANSSRGSGTEFYNSIYNVTGWDNADVPQTNIANQYKLPINPTYTENSPINYNLNNYTHTVKTVRTIANQKVWDTSTGSVYYADGVKYSNGAAITGGYSYTALNSGQMLLYYYLNNTRIELDNQIGFKPLTDIISVTDGLKVLNDNLYFDVVISASKTTSPYQTNNVYVNTVAYDCAYIIYDESIEKWRIYDADDVLQGSTSNVYIIKTGTMSGQIRTLTRGSIDPVYANPNELVPIGNTDEPTEFSKWSNTLYDSTLVNTRVGVLITGSLDIYPNASDSQPIQIRETGGIYTITIGSVVSSIGAYSGLYVVMDAQNNTLTVNGVLSFSTQAPAVQYELTPFTYSVAYTFATDTITALYFNGQLSGKAYIANTWVLSDPAGILWNDFNLNLTDYFADRIAQHGGVRFSINGTTYYGSSLTINGQTFQIIEDRIKYTTIEGSYTVEYEKPLNGLNVDYVNGSVILKFSDGTQYDTGARTTYVIAGAGAWFFSAGLSDIDTVASTEYKWSVGWSLDKNLTCVVFLGLLGLIYMLAAHYGRGQMGGFDYMILVLAGVIALVIMA